MNLRSLVMLSLCVITSGCALPWDQEESKAPLILMNIQDISPSKQALELVRNAVSPATHLQALEIQGKLKAVDSGEDKFSLRCEIQLIMERPAKLRLVATKGLNTQIMDLSMINDSLDVWLPRDKILYRGRVRDLSTKGMDFHPDEIVEQILFPVDEFNAMAWGIAAQSDDEIVVTEVSANRYKNRLTIDNKTGVLLRREIFSPDETVYLEASYSKHKELKGHTEIGLFPHQIELSFPKEKRNLLFYRLKIMPNPETSSLDYRFVAPKNAVIKPFNSDDQIDISTALKEVQVTSGERGE